jgi:N-acetylglucosaminyldiphosphoundecaprenol N-acetyl-beta-D-mannosaminyltransferase
MTKPEVHAPLRRLFGVGVHAVTMDQALAICRRAVQTRRHLNIGVVNAAKIVAMRRSPILFDAVADADLVLADGMAVVWAAKILRQPLPGRVTGIDLFERLLRLADECGYAVYFLGATQQVLDEVLRRVGRDHPRLRIAGSRNGYFSDDQAAGVAEDIRRSHADMLFVAMTSPKKELFLRRFGRHLDVAVSHGVGGSFDVLAGKVNRAPRTWQALGMEWLYRVLQEPRRMWKRYLVTNVQFANLLLHETLAPRPAKRDPADDAVPRPTEPARRSSPFVGGSLPDACRAAGSLQLAQLLESDGRWHVHLLPGLVDCMSRFRANGKTRPQTKEHRPDRRVEIADLPAAKRKEPRP